MEDASYGLAHDLAVLDREEPGWDYELQIKGALRRLREDASLANQRDVELLFGKQMADDALQRIRAEEVKVVADSGPVQLVDDGAEKQSLDLGQWGWLAVGQVVTAIVRLSRRSKEPQRRLLYTGMVQQLHATGGKTYLTLSGVNQRYVVGPMHRAQDFGKLESYRIALSNHQLVDVLSEDELSRHRRAVYSLMRAAAKDRSKPRKVANAFAHRRKLHED